MKSKSNLFLALFTLCVSQAHGQLTWDPAGNQTGSGGAGTWDTSTLNWDDDTVAPNVVWTNGSNAIFGGTGGLVAIAAGAGISVNNLTASQTSGNYTLDADTVGEGLTVANGATWSVGTGGLLIVANDTAVSMGSGETLNLSLSGTFRAGDARGGANLGLWGVGGAILNVTGTGTLQGGLNDVGQFATVKMPGGATFQYQRNSGGTTTMPNNWELGTGVVAIKRAQTNANAAFTLSGIISGPGGLTVDANTGTGAVITLSGNNTYTGKTTVTRGRLHINGAVNLGADPVAFASDFLTINGGQFTTNNNVNLTSNRGVTIGVNGGSIQAGDNDVNFNTAVTGAMDPGKNLTINTLGNAAFNAANNFTGDVVISAGGQVSAVSNHTLLSIGNAATNTVATLGNSSNPVSLGGYGQPNENVAALPGSAVLRFRRDDYTFAGPISGAGVVEISITDLNNVIGSTITLTGNNSYTGMTKISQGALKVASSWNGATGSLAPANIRFDQHGVLIIDGDLDTTNAADFARSIGTGDNQVQWTNGGGFAASGADRSVDIGGAGASFSWTSIGSANALFLSHPDANAKLTFLNPINLTATAGNRTLRVHDGAAAIDAEIPSVISGGAGVGIAKNDAGTLVLSGNNTYDGATLINTGTLRITNAGAIDNSPRLDPRGTGILDLTAVAPYSVGTGRTLTGSGTVTGAVTVSGILSPGIIAGTNTPGTLTTAAITLTGTAAFNADINSSSLAADRLKANGSVDLGSATLTVADVAVAPAVLPSGTKIALIDYTGHSLTGTFAGLAQGATVNVGGNAFTINYSDTTDGVTPGNYVTLNIAVSDPYGSWASSVSLTAPNAGKFDDKENDGIANILEWVLGANPLASDSDKLPTSVKSGTNLIFTFNRADSSLGNVALSVQYGSELTGWTTVPVPNDTSGTNGIFQFTDNGATDQVIATIPVGAATKQFARLKAE